MLFGRKIWKFFYTNFNILFDIKHLSINYMIEKKLNHPRICNMQKHSKSNWLVNRSRAKMIAITVQQSVRMHLDWNQLSVF